MKNVFKYIKFVAIIIVSFVIMGSSNKAFAYTFNANNLIPDGQFIDVNDMSVAEIQNFLNQKGGMLKDYSEGGRSAAQIIYDASHGHGEASGPPPDGCYNGICINTSTGTVNPKVLLVTLQKEQSLITRTDYNQTALNSAMGYGCPDSGGCMSEYAGFTNQVEWGAWQLRYNYERAYGHGFSDYQVGQTMTFNDWNGSHTVHIDNRATASLYRYTPHVYNGNYNFSNFYNDWFEIPLYGASYVTQNSPERAGYYDVALEPGEKKTIWVKFKNTGSMTWYRGGSNPIHLGTSSPHDRNSSFISSTRAANLKEESVASGETGTFEFTITAPTKGGVYYEHFEPVIEYIKWLGVDMHWKINVVALGGSPNASYVTQNKAEHPGTYDVALGPGETRTLWVKMKNTGSSIWFRNGINPTHLGTSMPHDRKSIFFGNKNLRSYLSEEYVMPGDYGTFKVYITAPNRTGIFYEHFMSVTEGVKWFGPDIHWKIYVAEPGGSYITQGPHTGPGNIDLVLSPGQQSQLWVKLKNTGDATWFKNGLNPVHLGTSSSQDRNSIFFGNKNLRSNLVDSVVIPGREGRFNINITAPSTKGTYYECFKPLMEYVKWFGPQICWNIKVQ